MFWFQGLKADPQSSEKAKSPESVHEMDVVKPAQTLSASEEVAEEVEDAFGDITATSAKIHERYGTNTCCFLVFCADESE